MVAWKPRGGSNITKTSSPFSTQDMMGGGGAGGSVHWGFKIPKASDYSYGRQKYYAGRTEPNKMIEAKGAAKDITPSNLQRSSGNRVVGKNFATKDAKRQTTKRRIQDEVLGRSRTGG